MGRGATFKPSQVGVFFGEPGKTVPHPYFGGEGPSRTGCIQCGGCMVGLPLRIQKHAGQKLPLFCREKGRRDHSRTARDGYHPARRRRLRGPHRAVLHRLVRQGPQGLRAPNVILSAYVTMGTVRLLLRCKHRHGQPAQGLRPARARRAHQQRSARRRDRAEGQEDRARLQSRHRDHLDLPSRRSHSRRAGGATPAGSDFMRFLASPMVDAGTRITRPLKMLWSIVRHPLSFANLMRNRDRGLAPPSSFWSCRRSTRRCASRLAAASPSTCSEGK